MAAMEVKIQELRSRCFFDIVIGGLPCGRIVFELFNEIVPKTCDNFRGLCAGDQGLGKNTNKPLSYNGVIFHRVVKDFIIQAGDFSNGNGTGGESIYGGTFEDENFVFNHDQPFLLSMANRGKNTNGSQFFITTQPAPHLDNIHVVFGKVVGGTDVVRQIENLSVDSNSRPLQDVRISKCGELVRQIKGAKKQREVEISNEENASDEGEHSSSKRKHKKDKKKSKKDKKPEKSRVKKPVSEEGEIHDDVHPLATVSNINPEDIPEVPVNKFLLRADSRNYINNRDRYNDRGGGFNRFNSREWPYNNRRDLRKPQITKSGRTIKGRGVFRFRTPSRSRSRSRSATPVHWRKEEARVIKLSDYKKQDGHLKPANTVASTVAIVQGPVKSPDQPKRSSAKDGDKRNNDYGQIDYNALDYEDEQQDMRQHLLEKRKQQQHPKLVQYPLPRSQQQLGYKEDVEDKGAELLCSPTNENSQVMLSNKRSEVLAMALGVQVKTGEDPPTGGIRFSGFDRKMKQQQQQQMGGPGGQDYNTGRQMSPGMEAALALGNKTVMSSVSRRAICATDIEQAAQNIKEREKMLHLRLLALAGNIDTAVPNVFASSDSAFEHQQLTRGRSRSKERHLQRGGGGGNRREKYNSERHDYDRGRDRRRERRESGGDRRPMHRPGHGRSGENRRKSRSKSRSRTPPMRGIRHISGGGSPRGTRNGTTTAVEKTHTPSPDKERFARKAEHILLLKKKMEAELREQLLLKQRKEAERKEQQRILLEKQRKAKEEVAMLDRAKRAQRDAAEKEKLLKTVKVLKQLDKKPMSGGKDSSSSAKRKGRSKRSPSSSSSSYDSSSTSTSSSSDSSLDRKPKRHEKDNKKYDKARRR